MRIAPPIPRERMERLVGDGDPFRSSGYILAGSRVYPLKRGEGVVAYRIPTVVVSGIARIVSVA